MARLPTVKSLTIEAFKDQASWISPLISALNSFMRSVVDGLNNNLTIGENLKGEVKTFKANGTYPIKLKWEKGDKPTIAWIGNVVRTNGAAIDFTAAPFLSWTFNQEREIQINDIIGLDDTNSKTYNVTVVFLVG